MFDELKEWLEAIFGAGYSYAAGPWEETESTSGSKFCAIAGQGGPPTNVEDRRQRFRILLTGPRNDRASWQAMKSDIYALAVVLLGDTKPCGAASIHAIGEPVGPGFTNENRAWFSLDLEIIF